MESQKAAPVIIHFESKEEALGMAISINLKHFILRLLNVKK